MKILIFQENTVECQKQLSFYSTITIIKGHDHQLFDHLKKYTSNLTILSSQLLRQINKIMGIQIFPVKYFRGNSINGSGLATLNLSFTVLFTVVITETDRVYPICGERMDQMPIFVFCNKIQIATLCNAVKKVTSKTTHLKAMSHLKEPELVAKIQNYFGVITSTEPPSTDNSTRSAEVKQNYVITNKFWYYLFIFGTALGDEAFYSCFIPFWFWNIDGAVGRRVVLIWTIVMYIGTKVRLVKIHVFILIFSRTSSERHSSLAQTWTSRGAAAKQVVFRVWNAINTCNGRSGVPVLVPLVHSEPVSIQHSFGTGYCSLVVLRYLFE
jgi:hypothetical protein